jgi:hypothetical protein
MDILVEEGRPGMSFCAMDRRRAVTVRRRK